jgi:hypothetical protein
MTTRILGALVLCAIFGLGFVGCGSEEVHHHHYNDTATTSECATCTANAKSGGWCDHCDAGVVGSRVINCRHCYAEAKGGHACVIH